MSVRDIAGVLIVVWGAIAVVIVVLVKRQFAKWDRESGDANRRDPDRGGRR